jgi:hypothetical protein
MMRCDGDDGYDGKQSLDFNHLMEITENNLLAHDNLMKKCDGDDRDDGDDGSVIEKVDENGGQTIL